MQVSELFSQSHTLLLDGGMGTMLQASGLKLGARPEELNITDPELIESIHGMYAAAGSRVINTNTFGASPHKLAGSPYTPEQIIAAGIACCKRACAPYGALTALDIGPLGELLEPIGTLSAHVPADNTGDIMGEVTKRRGRVLGMNPDEDGEQVVEAEVPMAEMQDFATFLRQLTQGRGWYTFDFVRYETLPQMLEGKVIEQAKALGNFADDE